MTTLQALSEMNGEFMDEQADQFAVRVGMAFSDTAGRIRYAYNLALGRPPTPAEERDAGDYLIKAKAALRDKVSVEKETRAALASFLRVLLSSNEFFFVD